MARTPITKEPYRPYKMVKLTLTPAVQAEMLMDYLSIIYGIRETESVNMEIISSHKLFGEMVAKMFAKDHGKILAKIIVENIDLRKEPKRYVCKYDRQAYIPEDLLDK